jgi:hypothetical protein
LLSPSSCPRESEIVGGDMIKQSLVDLFIFLKGFDALLVDRCVYVMQVENKTKETSKYEYDTYDTQTRKGVNEIFFTFFFENDFSF